MNSVAYLSYLQSLGWIAAALMAALVPVLPGANSRRHAAWLAGACALLGLAEAAGSLSGSANGPTPIPGTRVDWPQLLVIGGGMLLWEFARRVWNGAGRRSIPWITHAVAAEIIALSFVIGLTQGTSILPVWFIPIGLAAAVLPGFLGIGAASLLWPDMQAETPRSRRIALGTVVIGFACHGFFRGIPGLAPAGVVPPWVIVAGLAAACFSLPGVRSRIGLSLLAGIVVTAAAAPFVAAGNMRRVESAERENQLAQAAALTPLPGSLANQLRAGPPNSPVTWRALQQHLRSLAAESAAPSGIELRLFAGREVWTLGPTGEPATRPASTREIQDPRPSRVFVSEDQPMGRRTTWTVMAPVSPSRFEGPVAWLALDYPAPSSDQATRDGALLSALATLACTLGFSLVCRQAAENAQRLQLERAEAASRAKTEFLAFLSHELRTPLLTVLGRTELLQQIIHDPAQGRHLTAIDDQGRLLLRLVTDLLDLGTIEAGKLKLAPAPFDLRALLATLEETHGPVAAAKGLTLDIAAAPEMADHLLGDESRLRQILGNLLGNAVKFTSRGTVTLQVANDAATGVWVFTVTDTGPGIPPDKIPHLFTLFTRLDSGDTFTREGTGVGLALVRQLCALMGGSVTAANRPGGGAVFTVNLILPAADTDTATANAAPSSGLAGGLRVLVVEDNRAAREFLVEAVTALGHRTDQASDGDSALTACAAVPYDAVVLDVNLPGRDGIAVTRALRAQPGSPRIIGCSAEAFAHTREAALAAGMDAFLEKPVSLAALGAALTPAGSGSANTANLFERLRQPELMAKARALLATELPAALANLRAARESGDTDGLRRRAHQLRSTALFAGDTSVAEACRQLEEAAGTLPGDESAKSRDHRNG